MKILIYGAGVIGSMFAYKLKSGGNDVTVLARGRRLEQLKKYGIVIEDRIMDKQFRTDINVTDKLGPEDYYDVVLIIMQYQQVREILPVLKKNKKVPTFIFVGNNVNGSEEYLKFLGNQRVLLGFGGPGGYRENHFVIAAYVDYCILYFGEPDGRISRRVKFIGDTFQKAGIKIEVPQNMDAWLKTHAALISPLAMGGYAAKNKCGRLGDDDELIILSIKAFKENLKALEEMRIPILPKKFKIMKMVPAFFLKWKLKNLMNSEFGKIALSGHGDHAGDEMAKISKDFRELVRDARTDMSANGCLFEQSFK